MADVNKVAVAIAAREAMREHRKGKPVAFQYPTRPRVKCPSCPYVGGCIDRCGWAR